MDASPFDCLTLLRAFCFFVSFCAAAMAAALLFSSLSSMLGIEEKSNATVPSFPGELSTGVCPPGSLFSGVN